jgi:hypothetical protein
VNQCTPILVSGFRILLAVAVRAAAGDTDVVWESGRTGGDSPMAIADG